MVKQFYMLQDMESLNIETKLPIKYKQNYHPEFYKELKRRVDKAFNDKGISIKGNSIMKFKVMMLVVGYLITYTIIILADLNDISNLFLVIILGVLAALIGLNISHDAVHNAIFKRKWINYLFSFTFNFFLGANEYVWRITHNMVHHQFPNVPEMDPDISQTKLLRMSPVDKLKWFHKYQHFYFPIVYLLFGFYLVFIKDFRVIFGMNRLGNKRRMVHPLKEYIILFVTKIIYIGYMIVIPSMVFPFWKVIIAFILMQVILAIIFTIVTAPAHVATSNKYFTPNSKGIIEENWAVVQLETTTDFSRNSWIANNFFGGGNYQVVHHLFPGICHIHLPWISQIVDKTTLEYGLEYNHTSLISVLHHHVKMLRAFGQKEDPFS